MSSRLGTPRKKSVTTRHKAASQRIPLVRPSMRARPSTSAMAPAVSATVRVPRRPAIRYAQVLPQVKNSQ